MIVTTWIYLNLIELTNWDCVDFWNELYLFLRGLIKSYWFWEGVKMIICEWFLTKWRWSWISHSCSSINHRVNHSIICLAYSINITSNELQFRIYIFFTTVIIDCNPSAKISFSLILANSSNIIRFPWKTSCSISKLTCLSLYSLTKYFPIQCRHCKESIRNWS